MEKKKKMQTRSLMFKWCSCKIIYMLFINLMLDCTELFVYSRRKLHYGIEALRNREDVEHYVEAVLFVSEKWRSHRDAVCVCIM